MGEEEKKNFWMMIFVRGAEAFPVIGSGRGI